jgi:parallel beta-helix repeat protein
MASARAGPDPNTCNVAHQIAISGFELGLKSPSSPVSWKDRSWCHPTLAIRFPYRHPQMRRTKRSFARVFRTSFLPQPADRLHVQADVEHPGTEREGHARLSSAIWFRGRIRRKVRESATATLVIGLCLGGLGLGGVGLGVALSLGGQSAVAAPSSPPAQVCGNSSDLTGPSSAPAGAVTIPAGNDTSYSFSYDLQPNTTYWFAPGTHTFGSSQFGQMQALAGDKFIGAPGAILNGEGVNDYAFAPYNSTSSGVTIEYLTIEDFVAGEGQAVIDIGGTGTGWTIENNTIENNPNGAAVDISSSSVVTENCLTGNGEYGFDGYQASGPALGGGPTNVTLTNNEISYNGKAYYPDTSCGCSGGGKFWETGGGTVTGNYVHDNYDVGIWVDTNNYGFNISDNYISNNDAEGIDYELSYNAQIADNTLIDNGNASFAQDPAVYISESGGDSRVPGAYSGSFNITGNVMTNNWEGVRIWENSNRFCGNDQDGDSTSICPLVVPGTFTFTTCRAHLAGSTASGNPDYFDNCRWKAQNVDVSGNTFNLTSLSTLGSSCTTGSDCAENALLSEVATTPSDWSGADPYPGYTVPNNISNHQNNVFKDNVYNGPWQFEAFDGLTLTPAEWTTGLSNADGSGDPFGPQDAGSTFNS